MTYDLLITERIDNPVGSTTVPPQLADLRHTGNGQAGRHVRRSLGRLGSMLRAAVARWRRWPSDTTVLHHVVPHHAEPHIEPKVATLVFFFR